MALTNSWSLSALEHDTKLRLVTTTDNMAAYTFNDAMIVNFISSAL